MIRKILCILSVILVVSSLTACMAPSTPVTALTITEGKAAPDVSGYEKNLDGLVKYLQDAEVISGEGSDMSYDFIGAIAGKKFVYSYASASISCELYEFDSANLNETAKSVIASVQEKGTFQALDKEVHATLSSDQHFLMIYVNPAKDEAQQKLLEKTNTCFQNFK